MKTTWNNLKEFLINIFHNFGFAWWVEVVTQNPRCTYYFGPFLSLEQEGAQGIIINVKRCKPNALTIADDLGERIDRKVKPVFSGQM